MSEEHFERAVGKTVRSEPEPTTHPADPTLAAVMNVWDKLPASLQRLIQEVAAGNPLVAK